MLLKKIIFVNLEKYQLQIQYKLRRHVLNSIQYTKSSAAFWGFFSISNQFFVCWSAVLDKKVDKCKKIFFHNCLD